MMMMSHTAAEFHPPFSSPTISSVSSSDVDSESTGSFFHDRSISLGALMGVTTSYPTLTFRTTPPRQRENNRNIIARRRNNNININTSNKININIDDVGPRRKRSRRKRRSWWWLCGGDDLKPSPLGEFLEFERRFGAETLFSDALMDVEFSRHRYRNGGQVLFSDGRVLPPAASPSHVSDVNEGTHFMCSVCRFSVILATICGGGGVR
ncbi:uncharacterized protein At3g17950-like [Bidens hawaiensis]|uniref:uncharacterized protein At3g17950-like n=1 Tax=Bidens hawaiensis TaxID=980011 RepID=UPI0040495761